MKASSALLAGKKIAEKWFGIPATTVNDVDSIIEDVDAIEARAKQIALSRGYPEELAIAY